jgi:hypothetical protein
MTHCIYSIPCKCGRSFVGETGRTLAVCFREHRHSLRVGLLEKQKLAHHACEEGHRVGWEKARISEIECDGRCRKYKVSAHMAFGLVGLVNPVWSFLPFGFLISTNRSPTHREGWFMLLFVASF